jgi:hypothetical protein
MWFGMAPRADTKIHCVFKEIGLCAKNEKDDYVI